MNFDQRERAAKLNMWSLANWKFLSEARGTKSSPATTVVVNLLMCLAIDSDSIGHGAYA